MNATILIDAALFSCSARDPARSANEVVASEGDKEVNLRKQNRLPDFPAPSYTLLSGGRFRSLKPP